MAPHLRLTTEDRQLTTGIDFGSLGAGGAFGAGVVVAFYWFQKMRMNGRGASVVVVDQVRGMLERAEGRDERIVDGLNRLSESQARMATLLEVLVNAVNK